MSFEQIFWPSTGANLTLITGANLPVQNRCKSDHSLIYKERAHLIIDIPFQESCGVNVAGFDSQSTIAPVTAKTDQVLP